MDQYYQAHNERYQKSQTHTHESRSLSLGTIRYTLKENTRTYLTAQITRATEMTTKAVASLLNGTSKQQADGRNMQQLQTFTASCCWHTDKLPSVQKYHDDVKMHTNSHEWKIQWAPLSKISGLWFIYKKITVILSCKHRHRSVEITHDRRQGINSVIIHPPWTGDYRCQSSYGMFYVTADIISYYSYR